jgi:hypothetical protein
MCHRQVKASPEALLKSITPYRDGIVIAVECLFTWDWLADLCAQEHIPFVLGHALSMKAIHGGKAKNDRIDAHKIAVLLRGGLRPQADVSPAKMRATRELVRRRMHLMRKRAERLTHRHNTNSQYNLPEIGKQIAYTATREGGAERFPDPAVQKSLEMDLALLGHYDHVRRDVELTILTTARQHHANTLYLLRTVPDCRLVKCRQESAGTRYGTSGATIGQAYRTWAFSAAAVLFLRANPAGQKCRTRWEKKPGKGKALTVLAHKLARAVDYILQRQPACDMAKFLHG